jgi:hypothetical protein
MGSVFNLDEDDDDDLHQFLARHDLHKKYVFLCQWLPLVDHYVQSGNRTYHQSSTE